MIQKYSIDEITKLLKKAERYELLEQQGRLVELPCSFETLVFRVVPDCSKCNKGNTPEECGNKIFSKCKKKVMPCLFTPDLILEFGKTVFATESEAVVASVS
ncbi:hypothetical protein [Velocimicrobium porci]|uniref:Uncharacterized protein n=1 Tax=Velocimicrobium porci TaxID=2606634 RepID=A0A6L5XV88_9FIRM|nr:hypothetical protein [Velocimicrobium porci]MSS62750.1 hypothetical protein [Velocimicrobium porci]